MFKHSIILTILLIFSNQIFWYNLKMDNRHKKNIGIDFDGVIINHTKTKIGFAKKQGFKISSKQTHSEILKHIINKKKYKEIQKYIYGTGTSFGEKNIGVKKYLKKLQFFNFNLFLISRRNTQKSKKETISWINKNLPGFFDKQNIFFVNSDKEKNIVCKKLNINTFLDDKISVFNHLNSVKNKFFYNLFKISFDYNRKKIKSVSSWKEFFEKIKAE